MEEFKIAESLGGLTAAIQGFEKKFSEFVTIHGQEHGAIWNKLDIHGRRIVQITSFFAAIGTLLTILFAWMKLKLGDQ